MSKLLAEIKQEKPFPSVREELWLNLSRTASAVAHEFERKMRPYGLSSTQYNVLRILRGAGVEGLVQGEVGVRLVAQMPDVPRILTRMHTAGWVTRVRGTDDRRVVRVTLTAEGLRLVNDLDAVIDEVTGCLFAGMTEEEMLLACDLLVAARGGLGK